MTGFRGILADLLLISTNTPVVSGQHTECGAIKEVDEQLPQDINPVSRNRVPPIKLEDFDDYGKQLLAKVAAEGRKIIGVGGTSAIRAYSPHVLESMDAVNYYLRKNSGIDLRLVELAILVTAREMDSGFVWTYHEKEGLKAGLSQEIVDVVKFRKPIAGMDEAEAAIVQLGREAFGDRKVSSDTFARALKIFGKQGLVDIVTLMGDYSATAILLFTFDQHLPPGEVSTLPERKP